jgi:hypothetical protein
LGEIILSLCRDSLFGAKTMLFDREGIATICWGTRMGWIEKVRRIRLAVKTTIFWMFAVVAEKSLIFHGFLMLKTAATGSRGLQGQKGGLEDWSAALCVVTYSMEPLRHRQLISIPAS